MSSSISKHNVLSLYFCACPCTHAILHALHRSSQLKWCFTRTSDDLWINLLMGLLMKRFSVLSWCRADVHCYPSNELYFGAPAKAFWKGSLLISGFHYKHQTGQHLHHCTGFYLWCPGQTHSRETKGGLSNFLHLSVQEAEQPKSNENPYFNSLLDGSKGCLTMNSKEKQTKTENSLFPLYEQHGFLSGELFYDILRW